MLELATTLDQVVPLGRGDPDIETPSVIVERGAQARRDGHTHYTAPAGIPPLREAICNKLQLENGLNYAPRQIIVTNGCQEAILITMLNLLAPEDEVILQAPRFNAFDHMVNLAGGRVVSVMTTESNENIVETTAKKETSMLPYDPINAEQAVTDEDVTSLLLIVLDYY